MQLLEQTKAHSLPRSIEWTLIALFIVMMVVPGIMLLGRWQVAVGNTEKRVLVDVPPFHWSTFYTAPYRRSIESYLNDNFGFRPLLVQWNLKLYVQVFKTVPVRGVAVQQGTTVDNGAVPTTVTEVLPNAEDQAMSEQPLAADQQPAVSEPETLPREHVVVQTDAIVGKDGWYFYAQDNVIDDYRATQPLTNPELQQIADNLMATRDRLANQGIDFVVMVAPNKATVYGEYMPDIYNVVGSQTRLDQIQQYLRTHTDIEIVDPRQDLLAAKSDSRLYEKTGTHWNDYGAFIAYQTLMRQAHSFIPSLAIPSLSDYSITTRVAGGADLAIMLSLQNDLQEQQILFTSKNTRQAVSSTFDFPEPNLNPEMHVIAKEIPGSTAPRLLMFRDSFSNALIPFISEQFSRSVYVWSYDIPQYIIDAEHPDIIIMEIVERNLFEALGNGLN